MSSNVIDFRYKTQSLTPTQLLSDIYDDSEIQSVVVIASYPDGVVVSWSKQDLRDLAYAHLILGKHLLNCKESE